MKKLIFPIAVFAMFFFSGTVFAYQIQNLPDTEVKGDIVLGPTKIELFLDPGETTSQELIVTNRTGRSVNFTVGIEDFQGSHNPDQAIVFLGSAKGPYSLKDWLKPELNSFILEHGQRIFLPIQITIPQSAEPGGYYGVIFAIVNPEAPETEEEIEATKGQVAIVSRAGALFFVRISGEVQESGQLTDLQTQKKFYEKGPIPFSLLFDNTGSVHLAPYGTIEIKNLLGRKVGELELDPWFALPDSVRLREVTWEKGFLFGRYVATAIVNRGYQDIVDQKSVEFWVIPWKIMLAGLAVLILVIWFLFWIASHFEIKRKTETAP